MKTICRFFFSASLLAGFLFLPVAHAWGCKGHQTVAYLAELHLTPEAKQMVHQLLSDNPIDPQLRRWCGEGGMDEMANSATWADDYRDLDSTVNQSHPTGGWHFIDIPFVATPENVDGFCSPTGCVTKAITEQLAILKSASARGPDRAMALRFLIHFLGDIHQPLHTADNDDRGGNCVPVKYLKRTVRDKNNVYTPNLHHIWDTEIVEAEMEGADPQEFAARLDTQFTSSIAGWEKGGVRVAAWAWEGHEHAMASVYGGLPVKIKAEPAGAVVKSCADDNDIGQRMLHKHIVVNASYIDMASLVVDERVAQAGIRLAMILNEVARTRR